MVKKWCYKPSNSFDLADADYIIPIQLRENFQVSF